MWHIFTQGKQDDLSKLSFALGKGNGYNSFLEQFFSYRNIERSGLMFNLLAISCVLCTINGVMFLYYPIRAFNDVLPYRLKRLSKAHIYTVVCYLSVCVGIGIAMATINLSDEGRQLEQLLFAQGFFALIPLMMLLHYHKEIHVRRMSASDKDAH